ncbi:MAG: sulfurtransferase TusA family protein [Geminicoccaceae bacterium]
MASNLTEETLDITADVCPMTFVKAKLFMEALPLGAIASIRLREGEPLDNVTRSMRDHGQEILTCNEQQAGIFVIQIKKLRAL